MPTVLRVERHAVEADHVDRYTALLADTVDAMRAQPGSLWADTAEATDDRPSFIVLSEWRTTADLDAWEASERAADLQDRGDPDLREPVSIRRFMGADEGVFK